MKLQDMVREILIDTGFFDTRAIVMEEGKPVELYIEDSDRKGIVGNIYRGKVKEVLPGMQAAFVDIGLERNAFLPVPDIIRPVNQERKEKKDRTGESDTEIRSMPVKRVEDLVKPGQEITVQVTKEPIGAKGACVTMDITLPGKYTVLSPMQSGLGVSKKITRESERERLGEIAGRLCPEGMGLVLRTASKTVEETEINNEIQFQQKLWEGIVKNAETGPVPRCVYQEIGLARKLAREYPDDGVTRFIVNDPKEYQKIKDFLETVSPKSKNNVAYFSKAYDLFAYYHVESAFKEALSRKVWLKCGGYLVFDKTEAFTVIDVNTGKFTGKNSHEDTIFKVNQEAVLVIGRQVRLRNIGGIILIDFIDMKEGEHREQILSLLVETVRRDRAGVFVHGMTTLGLVEMTRKKARGSIEQALTTACPLCEGMGRLLSSQEHARAIMKNLFEVMNHSRSPLIEVTVHPDIHAILFEEKKSEIENMGRSLQKRIKGVPSRSIEYGKMAIKEVDTL